MVRQGMDGGYCRPDILFYVTQSFHVQGSGHLGNSVTIYGKLDCQIDGPNSRIFPTLDERIAAGYVDGNDSDMPAILGERNIGLVYHGVKNPTEEQFDAVR